MSNYSLIKLQVSKQLAARGHRPASHFIPEKPTPMRLPLSSRRDALSLLALSALPALPPTALPAVADMGAVAPGYNPGETAEDLAGALGGLKPGSGRPLNALIKMRSETGIVRVGDASPLFKAGQILDQLKTADGAVADVGFSFPPEWTLAGGPNLDVRDVKASDSAFVLAAPMPKNAKFEALKDDFFLEVLFDPAGKFGQYGKCDDRKVVTSTLEPLSLPTGQKQLYRTMAIKFAPLTYNGNTVERKALISATSVGGTVFMIVAGALATRYKKMQPDLLEVQQSFRAIGRAAAPAPA